MIVMVMDNSAITKIGQTVFLLITKKSIPLFICFDLYYLLFFENMRQLKYLGNN